MQHRHLGNSGLSISAVSLGSWMTFVRLGPERVQELVDLALDHGVNFFDTADIYDHGEAEKLLGSALAGRRREHLVIASKCYWPMSDDPNDRGLSRKHLVESCEQSLRRMGLDYLDLFQCHRYDEDTPLEETVMTMGDLVRRGKILYWGTSCWSAEQLQAACAIADQLGVPRPASEQPQYNLLRREIEDTVLPACEELGVGLIVWSPLAQGLLTGKYRRGAPIPEDTRAADAEGIGRWLAEDLRKEAVFDLLERLEAIAAEASMTLARLALAWCLRQEALASVIVGATRPDQLRENLEAAAVDWSQELDRKVSEALARSRLA